MEIIILFGVIAILAILVLDKQSSMTSLLNINGKKRRIIIDSCVLIDGRIVELVKTGFLTGDLVLPKFILRELQHLADGPDAHKRERARFGLETAVTLQELGVAKLDETSYSTALATDDKLIILSKEKKAALCTTDFNLNKVAKAEGLEVLNINELAQALRPTNLPGEEHTIKLIQKGNNKNQGVGYLSDGTMVVVEGGSKYVGKTVTVVMDHMLQTAAGKMSFAKIKQVRQSLPAEPAPVKAVPLRQAPNRTTVSRRIASPTKRAGAPEKSASTQKALARLRTAQPARQKLQ